MSAPFSVSVGTSATLIVAANTRRQTLIVANVDATLTVFVGEDNTVTTANGVPIFAETDRVSDRGFGLYLGPVFGIVSSGTADVRVWETLGRE